MEKDLFLVESDYKHSFKSLGNCGMRIKQYWLVHRSDKCLDEKLNF